MRTPLYTGHFTRSPKVSTIGWHLSIYIYGTLHLVSKVSTIKGFHCSLQEVHSSCLLVAIRGIAMHGHRVGKHALQCDITLCTCSWLLGTNANAE